MNRRITVLFLLLTFVGLCITAFLPKSADESPIDKIVVLKSKRRLSTYRKGKLVKNYTVELGLNPVGDKKCEGDYKTPEGSYTINGKNPKSAYFMNLGISYPNKADLTEAKKLGKKAGGDIKIHGQPNGSDDDADSPKTDWTHGCIALSNADMKELYRLTPIGTPITIKP